MRHALSSSRDLQKIGLEGNLSTSRNKRIFEVDDTSDLPIWVQLRNRITYLIRTGHFQAGQQLPSIRSLAADAKINYNTVTKAYRELELAGLVVMVRGRGMYVQKNLADEDEPEMVAADMLLEDCVRKYRTQGMTFEEIDHRMRAFVESMRREADEAAETRMEYYGEE